MVGQETAQVIKQTGDIQLAMKKELSIDDFAIYEWMSVLSAG
jgi:hypothetical protein